MTDSKMFAETIRKILLIFLSQKDPLSFITYLYVEQNYDICKDKNQFKNLIEYLVSKGLLRGDSAKFWLTDKGLTLAQEIYDDDIWNQALSICESNNLSSLDSITYAVREIIKKKINDDIHSKK